MSEKLKHYLREQQRQQGTPGRPPAEYETVQVTVRLRPDQVERLKSLAAKKRTAATSNMSAIIRMAVDEFFAR